MKFLRFISAALAAMLLLAGTATAAYQSEDDLTLSATLLPGLIEPDETTGDTTFSLQEGAHDTLTDSTGQSVDHYYIWVEVNGSRVLAVDPLTSYEFE